VVKQVDLKAIDDFVFDALQEHPKDIAKVLSARFGISRQAASGHLRRLVRKGLLVAKGRTRARRYHLAKLVDLNFTVPVNSELAEDEVWALRVLPSLRDMPDNVRAICTYGFTEMLNNVKDHSGSNEAVICIERTAANVQMLIADYGVGVFRKIKEAGKLEDERHAILELVKGKFTTDPNHHTGEGIFFTSRMFDRFWLGSGVLSLLHNRAEEDWLIESTEMRKGTAVIMKISSRSTHTDEEVFLTYATAQDDYAFRRTHLIVSLARSEGEGLVSRSQAKRLMSRLERFREVVLDFKGVNAIGPAFADEVFRVFQREHPEIRLLVINENKEVGLMIKRALAESEGQA
jgi:anti-sigma regulatory factor (Ser/Thr protein kinase)